MNAYEMTFIVRPDLDEEATRAAVDQVTGRIETTGGELLATVPWNPPRRRMAYPIREYGDGYYVTTVFRLDPQQVRTFENQLKLNENVIRFLLVQATETNIQQAQQRVAQAAAAAARPAPPPAPAPEVETVTETVPIDMEAEAPVTAPVEAESVSEPEAAPVPELAAVAVSAPAEPAPSSEEPEAPAATETPQETNTEG